MDKRLMEIMATAYPTPEQIGGLTPEQIGGLTPEQIGGLMRSQIGGLTRSQIGGLMRSQIGGLTRSQIGWLTRSQIGWLTRSQIGGLTRSQIGWFTRSQIGWFTWSQIGWFTRSQIGGFTRSQIGWFTPEQIGWFTPERIGGFTRSQIGWFTRSQIEALELVRNAPKVERLYSRIVEDIRGESRKLDQSRFGPNNDPGADVCNTPMCIAGHTINLAGAPGYSLSYKFGFETAARLIHYASRPEVSCPRYDSYPNEWAMAYIEARAAEEVSA